MISMRSASVSGLTVYRDMISMREDLPHGASALHIAGAARHDFYMGGNFVAAVQTVRPGGTFDLVEPVDDEDDTALVASRARASVNHVRSAKGCAVSVVDRESGASNSRQSA